ncbi:MAG: C-GCAxxG-C-C family protein [Muribaculaceae bacterium]|nr:C-GCAxxG-C-C family protein [Roseburia sp.]MCM1431943.1 C-GCAxxG-C-C family protein [Muribaculaceae bacterium]MCM1493537.1 C-GCAxxG-C-C family protein [Muribaculaceae bacterium]
MTRREKAMRLFEEGYNCTQSVVLAFADLIEIPEETLAQLVSAFGGGMGRLREVCGSMSGVFFVTGMLYGYHEPKDFEGKKELYAKVQELAGRFEEQNGSIVCRELLGLDHRRDKPEPSKRTEEYYKKRPCKELIGSAAEILEKFMEENPV